VKVKICGLTRPADAEAAARAGVDFIGINFWPQSKRHVSCPRAAELAAAARLVAPDISVVGVFVNQSLIEIAQISELVDLDYVQLHGNEPAALAEEIDLPVIRAVAPTSETDLDQIANLGCDYILVDAPSDGFGGSGKLASWSLARLCVEKSPVPVLLAGGLTPDNVAAAVAEVSPFAVDVASGVEDRPGVKNIELVERFVAEARGASS